MSTNSQTVKTKSAGQRLQRFFMNIHIGLYRRSNGALGGKMSGRPMLLLTTIGRKSGEPRVTPIMYTRDGNDYILIASNGGAPQHPQWYRNLETNDQAKIQVGPQIIDVTAKTANPEERARLWAQITGEYKNFADYQKKTTREIPVVILTPNTPEQTA